MSPQSRMIETRFSVRWLLGVAALFSALPPCASAADPFVASVLSCAAEIDQNKRLECYDRTVANFTATLPRTSNGRAAAAASSLPIAPPGITRSEIDRAATATQPAATNQVDSHTGASLRHLTAKIVSIDYVPDHMVLHLDNNQVWQQVAEASTELHLHVGDTVTIDKQMGSYWLSGRKGDGTVQITQKQ